MRKFFQTIITCNSDTCLCLILPDNLSANDKVEHNILPNICYDNIFLPYYWMVLFKVLGEKTRSAGSADLLRSCENSFFSFHNICFSTNIRSARGVQDFPNTVKPSLYFLSFIYVTLEIVREETCDLFFCFVLNSSNSCCWWCRIKRETSVPGC